MTFPQAPRAARRDSTIASRPAQSSASRSLAKNSALTLAGAELRLANGVTLLGKFDGEFASHSSPMPPDRRAAEKGDKFPPPHGAYPKAKDHELIIAPCMAAKTGRSIPEWVISDRGAWSHTTAHVRFAPKSDRSAIIIQSVAKCHKRL